MKDISTLKKQLEDKYAKQFCNLFDISQCPKGDQCDCRAAAEIRAYIEAVIPAPYYDFTIDDFTGKYKDTEILSPEVAVRAKSKLVQYCWGMDLARFVKMDSDNRFAFSKISERRQNAANVVIYADPKIKSGKSFVAALILREAIQQRVIPGNLVQTYDWIEFSLLSSALKADPTSLNYTRSCDWLVIDDIRATDSTKGQDAFISSLLDPFFFERLQDGLPTILVFRFNIVPMLSTLEEKFGTAISQIVNDNKTFRISLCGK